MNSGDNRDRPWIMRTYSGHSSAGASNRLYRRNMAKGQTGLSVAFDLPTQAGYDSDHRLARAEVGKVGVPIDSIADMEALFDGVDLDRMNTSMTINATAPWLLALYIATAERSGVDPRKLQGTIQNDIVKEYLSRGTYVFPPAPSMRLTADVIEYTVARIPKWNPINICSYHLQEAGATAVEELAFALANATAVLDEVRSRASMDAETFALAFGRFSFFVNAGIHFIEETCKMRAFVDMWDHLGRERYGIEDPKLRRFRYGVQVNSLGLTEQQPENNAIRITLEMLGVVLSKDARARAVQLPAWNEALGLPRPWDQQWALRTQQIMAFETDLLAYGDIFEGSKVIAETTERLKREARREIARIEELGGAVAAVESSYMKQRLVESNSRRLARIENGDLTVVGVNAFAQSEDSPLTARAESSVLKPDRDAEREQVERLASFRSSRDDRAVKRALGDLRATAEGGGNVMPASIAAAHAGVTTGEWAGVMREIFGEYRAPTGVAARAGKGEDQAKLRAAVARVSKSIGHVPRLLVAKPGLDGHSNGAEQIAVRARDAGMEVLYQGIRLSIDEIASSAQEEDADAVGLSILSGSHMAMVPELIELLADALSGGMVLVVGGIIPEDDAERLLEMGVSRVYTPKDYQLDRIIGEVLDLIEKKKVG